MLTTLTNLMSTDAEDLLQMLGKASSPLLGFLHASDAGGLATLALRGAAIAMLAAGSRKLVKASWQRFERCQLTLKPGYGQLICRVLPYRICLSQ